MHTFYETGVSIIDDFFPGEPSSGWNSCGFNRDIGGCVFNNRVNFNSPYIDLRSLPDSKLNVYKREMLRNLSRKGLNNSSKKRNASEFLTENFGETLKDDILSDFISIRQNLPSTEVHSTSTKIQKLDRVILFNLNELIRFDSVDGLRQISAFPDQLNYPVEFLPEKRVFYPNAVGINQSINKLEHILNNENIKILKGWGVKGINTNRERIRGIEVENAGGESQYFEADTVVWTIPLFNLFNKLFPKDTIPPFDLPRKTIIVNLVSSTPPNSRGLYWILSHGHPFVHRISFPDNYANSVEQKFFKICVECIFDNNYDSKNLKKQVVDFLIKINILVDEESVIFSDVIPAPGGFPNFSMKNITALENMRNRINSVNLKNLLTSVFYRKMIFFSV